MTARMNNYFKYVRPAVFILVAAGHLAAIFFIRIGVKGKQEKAVKYEIIKLVDVEEYSPPADIQPAVPEDTIVTDIQPVSSESIIEVDKEVLERADGPAYEEPDYLPQHKISQIPVVPTQTVLDRIEYPAGAWNQEIEGVVYLELFIDQYGTIRKINVLKDPGYGFAEAALKALDGITCKPAMANGTPVAVRFRYPIRFTIH